MHGQDLSTEVQDASAAVLDHSRDFVELLCQKAPGEYLKLIASPQFQRILDQENNFNYGKIFAFAEFVVFRREFNSRFPQASSAACINAFSRLFLKNDISITNLIRFLEGSDELEQLRLNSPD